MEIRGYTNSDFEAVLKILKESFPDSLGNVENILVSDDALDLNKDNYIQLVALLDDKVVGYVIVSESYDPIIKRVNFWINYVCVDVEYRGRGVAKRLLMKVEELAKEKNVLYLQLTSSRFRTSARKLYMDLGYEVRESDIFRKVLSC